MTLTVSDWFYRGVTEDGGVLSIDPAYFSITGGRERWLYRVARKHAGGNGADGFTISLPTLFEKSGAEGTYRRFKFEIIGIVRRDELPGYTLALELDGDAEPSLIMRRTRSIAAEEGSLSTVLSAKRPRAKKPKKVEIEQPTLGFTFLG